MPSKNIMFLRKYIKTILIICMLANNQSKGFAQDIINILDYGVQAPSSHNAQMWKVDTTYNSISISLDSTRILDKVDPHNREAWISLGAFAENCVLSALDLGYVTDLKIKNEYIKLNFIKSDTLPNTNYRKLITNRKTTRKKYKKQDLLPEHRTEIEIYDSFGICFYPLNSEQGKIIFKSLSLSNLRQLNDTAKLRELSEWTITSFSEAKKRCDGLSASDIGLGGLMKFFYYGIYNKEKIQSKGFINSAQKRLIKQAENCSGFILITSDKNERCSWIHSGRLLQKIWLKLTELDIKVHPMSQAIEEEFYTDLKNDLELQNKEIQMILRIGYLGKRKDKSKRRPIF